MSGAPIQDRSRGAACYELRAGSAAELAWRLERLLCACIALRVKGSCLDRRHPHREHALGCAEMGIPLQTIGYALRAWDSVGAAGLLLEAAECAVRGIASSNRTWSAELASEIVAHEIRCRITPHGPDAKPGPPQSTASPVRAQRVRYRGLPRTPRPRGAASPG